MKKPAVKKTISEPERDRNKRIKFLKFSSLFIAIVTIGLVFIYMQTLDHIKQSKEENVNILKEERFEQIYSYATNLRALAAVQSSEVAIAIESDIREQMDMVELKDDMDANRVNEQLQEILHDNAYDKYLYGVENRRNAIFIASKYGILEDCNMDRAAVHTVDYRTWDYEIANCYNSDLEEDAIKKLVNKSSDLIVTEHVNYLGKSDSNYNSHEKIKSPSKEVLKDMYMKEGMLGLRNYQFLTPAYITETGDIFGQPEISHGIANETHTFIVVQEFNLYDQIKQNHPEMMDTSNIYEVETSYANILTIMNIIGIGYAVILVALLFLFSAKYNNYIDKHELEEEYMFVNELN